MPSKAQRDSHFPVVLHQSPSCAPRCYRSYHNERVLREHVLLAEAAHPRGTEGVPRQQALGILTAKHNPRKHRRRRLSTSVDEIMRALRHRSDCGGPPALLDHLAHSLFRDVVLNTLENAVERLPEVWRRLWTAPRAHSASDLPPLLSRVSMSTDGALRTASPCPAAHAGAATSAAGPGRRTPR